MKSKRKTFRETGVIFLFLAPAFIFYLLFLFLPLFGNLVISFYDWSGYSIHNLKFVGLSNYVELLLVDPVFWRAFWHNLVFIFFSITITVTLGLIIALLLEMGLGFSKFFRGVFFIPNVLSFVVIGILFTLILSPEFGLVNPSLKRVGLGHLARAWLGEPGTVLFSVISIRIWRTFGFSMFLFIAALKSIPLELYEAARIDGADYWRSLWYITLPLLKEISIVVIVLAMINSFKLFDLVYVMTYGGPCHASEVIATWSFMQGFSYDRMGYGCAIAVMLFLIIFVFTLINLRVLHIHRRI